MHDSLPSEAADLTALLGEVRGWTASQQASENASVVEQGDTRLVASSSHAGGVGTIPSFPLNAGHPYHLIVVAGQECPTANGVFRRGWTSILERWLCEDVKGSTSGEKESEDEFQHVGRNVAENENGGKASAGAGISARSQTAGSQGGLPMDQKTQEHGGPYILVEKERLMGIYCAVFVARGCEKLIQGISTGRVTAGLLGGRLGNKGAVAISLKFGDSRLLFISAHLAAHAEAAETRKANVRKILAELEVDDFTDAPAAEGDISNRFDQTFFLGDLNFRLDLSRLHADFLIKKCDYATALQFDQLKKILSSETNSCFDGFREGEIAFPPTYKYDIVAPPKLKRTPTFSKGAKARIDPPTSPNPPSSAKSFPSGEPDPPSSNRSKDPDSTSLSSIGSSHSAGLEDPNSLDAVTRAQIRFRSLIRANSRGPMFVRKPSQSGSPKRTMFSSPPSSDGARPNVRKTRSDVVISPTEAEESAGLSSDEEIVSSVEPDQWDSSRKQRVQSYTDRVLFKSTIIPAIPVAVEETPPATRSFLDSLKEYLVPHASDSQHASSISSSKSPTSILPQILPRRRAWSDAPPLSDHPHPHHHHFPHLFGRRHRRTLASRSVESFGSSPPNSTNDVNSPRRLRRTRSANTAQMLRRASIAPSVATVKAYRHRFWRRSSVPAAAPVRPTSYTSPSTTPLALSPNLARSDLPSFPTPPHSPLSFPPPVKARRNSLMHFEVAEPHGSLVTNSNPVATRNFPRPRTIANNFPLSLTRTSGRTVTGNRFKSLLNYIPNPFTRDDSEVLERTALERVGPRRGEVNVLEYKSVLSLAEMQMQSDHRPVVCVLAVGVGDE